MNILDENIEDFHDMYRIVVKRWDEWVPAVSRIWARTRGHEPTTPDWLHIYIRCMSEERKRWKTTRQTLEHEGVVPEDTTSPTPGGPPVTTSWPHNPIRIDGPFKRRQYAYWANAWVHPDGSTYVFAGREDGPRFYRISTDGSVTDMQQMSVRYGGETEGWWWNSKGQIYLISGSRLVLVNPFDGHEWTVMTAPDGHTLDQAHSSDDDSSFSATMKDSSWRKVGTLFVYHGRQLDPVWAVGDLDESIITKCSEFGLVQESHNNRVITLATGEERGINDWERAVAHCDTGHGIVIGESDKPDPGALVMWDLRQPLTLDRCHILAPTLMMGHVSYQNGRCLWSNASERRLEWLDIHSGARTSILSVQNWDPLIYDRQVRANLSPCGTRMVFMEEETMFVMAV